MYVQRRYGIPTPSGAPVRRLCGELALDESESLRAVLVDVLLVGVGIVAVAAVRIRSITVGLDLAVVRAASLASWTGRELNDRSVSQQDLGYISE